MTDTESIVFTVDRGATVTVTRYIFTVPSSAVTVIVKLFEPAWRFVFPAITAVAYALVGTASTATDVRPRAMLNEELSTASFPSTLKVLRDVSFEKSSIGSATFKVTVVVDVATPFSAVTTTVKMFAPVFRAVAPVTTALALLSVGSATTVTEVTPLAS